VIIPSRTHRIMVWGIAVLAALGLSVIASKMYDKGVDHWLPNYVRWARSTDAARAATGGGPIHVMFLTVDHFEPGSDTPRVREWSRDYARLAARHHDSEGLPPRHTWFYPAEQFRADQMAILSDMCRAGYGEVELHLHHGYDTSESLRAKLRQAARDFGAAGALVTGHPARTAFAFVHGNMSLDNSRGDYFCGVNNEMSLLQAEGCFADFTFPSLERGSQPRTVNRLYYAADDPQRPGSYLAGGPEMEVGKKHSGLLVFQGPVVVDFSNWRHILYPAIDVANFDYGNVPDHHRVDTWITAGVHVRGRPEWVFVKTWVHGAKRPMWSSVVGADADEMFSYPESRYNDGQRYVLHYLTAREAYNIAKAAEAGKSGDPARYRDYIVEPYRNSRRQPQQIAVASKPGAEHSVAER
jgi:hypothetical protein